MWKKLMNELCVVEIYSRKKKRKRKRERDVEKIKQNVKQKWKLNVFFFSVDLRRHDDDGRERMKNSVLLNISSECMHE